MMNEEELRKNIAGRMIELRKNARLTQAELAEKINYSDKSVSKWERGDGLPDIFVLYTLSDLYGVTVNDFLTKTEIKPAPARPLKRQILIVLMSVGIAWLSATVIFFIIKLLLPHSDLAWYSFLIAVPASAIISTVFSSLWWNKICQFVSISAIIWSVAVCFDMTVNLSNSYLIYIVTAVLEVLCVLWFLYRHIASKDKAGRKSGR